MVKCKDGPYVDFEQHQEIVAALAAENERLWNYTVDLLQQVSAVRSLSDSEKELIAAAKEGGDAK